jgi:hypothetical protein
MTTQPCLACDFPGGGNCSVCHGKGTVPSDEISAASPLMAETACPACGGSGECQQCGGLGEIEVGGEAG